MPNRKKWIRYVLYAVEILLLFLLQDTPGLLPQIMGVKPLPVLSAALTIAMVEACTPAMAFGMYAGFLADVGSGAVFGYHALTFGVLCFLLSGLCGTRIQIQLFTSVLMGLWSCAVAVLLDWLVLYVAAGYSLTLYALVTKYLPIYFYTLLTIPVCYGLQAWVRKPRVRSAIRRRRSKLHKLQKIYVFNEGGRQLWKKDAAAIFSAALCLLPSFFCISGGLPSGSF